MRSQQSNRSSKGDGDAYKYELPEECFVSMVKKVKIEKLEDKFNLLAHPLPQISGEMLILRTRKED